MEAAAGGGVETAAPVAASSFLTLPAGASSCLSAAAAGFSSSLSSTSTTSILTGASSFLTGEGEGVASALGLGCSTLGAGMLELIALGGSGRCGLGYGMTLCLSLMCVLGHPFKAHQPTASIIRDDVWTTSESKHIHIHVPVRLPTEELAARRRREVVL